MRPQRSGQRSSGPRRLVPISERLTARPRCRFFTAWIVTWLAAPVTSRSSSLLELVFGCVAATTAYFSSEGRKYDRYPRRPESPRRLSLSDGAIRQYSG